MSCRNITQPTNLYKVRTGGRRYTASLAKSQIRACLHDCLQDDDARQSRTRGVKQVHLIQHHIRVQHLGMESRTKGGGIGCSR